MLGDWKSRNEGKTRNQERTVVMFSPLGTEASLTAFKQALCLLHIGQRIFRKALGRKGESVLRAHSLWGPPQHQSQGSGL